MPPDLVLLSTLIGSNYPCLELIVIIPKVFEPLKFDCICFWIHKTVYSLYYFGILKVFSSSVRFKGSVYLSCPRGAIKWGNVRTVHLTL